MSKPAELREQTDEQLDLLLKEVQHNLFRLRLQSETERLEAPSEIVKAKREIARIKTILRQREIEREKSTLAATVGPAVERYAGSLECPVDTTRNDRMIKSHEKI